MKNKYLFTVLLGIQLICIISGNAYSAVLRSQEIPDRTVSKTVSKSLPDSCVKGASNFSREGSVQKCETAVVSKASKSTNGKSADIKKNRINKTVNNNNEIYKTLFWCVFVLLITIVFCYFFKHRTLPIKIAGKKPMLDHTNKGNKKESSSIIDDSDSQYLNKLGETDSKTEDKMSLIIDDSNRQFPVIKGEIVTSFAEDDDEWIVVGASVIGNGHISSHLPCQDNCVYKNLGSGWGIAITSDGAGSAANSQIGSKIVVSRGLQHFESLIISKQWKNKNELPTDAEWLNLSYYTIKAIRDDLAKFATTKSIELHSLNATIIVLIYSPLGILVAHVGDGRCGYRDSIGKWKSLIEPHKGEEANQTIFIPSDFWNVHNYIMSGVLVPESRVIREKPFGFILMSDGCENTTWLCNRRNEETGKYYDPNIPYDAFFNNVFDNLQQMHNSGIPLEERKSSWEDFMFTNGKFAKEQDDKTLIVGALNL